MIYEEFPEKSDIILINSHHSIFKIILLKLKFPNKIVIHRIDGPIFSIRSTDLLLDKVIYKVNNFLADGTIFQSIWSQKENHNAGLKININEIVIINAVDDEIFYTMNQKSFKSSYQKTKLIAVSWSDNWNKGFALYHYLDKNLDFSRYDMIFVGNSPISFKNIKHIEPVSSVKLADILKKNDIYITGSINDPCSNSLIEALSCGLPSCAINSGGHPEIINNGGELFSNFRECILKIEKVRNNYNYYRERIKVNSITETTQSYIKFMSQIHKERIEGKYFPKQIKIWNLCIIILLFLLWNIREKGIIGYFKNLVRKLRRI